MRNIALKYNLQMPIFSMIRNIKDIFAGSPQYLASRKKKVTEKFQTQVDFITTTI